jgi:hypothetical protein
MSSIHGNKPNGCMTLIHWLWCNSDMIKPRVNGTKVWERHNSGSIIFFSSLIHRRGSVNTTITHNRISYVQFFITAIFFVLLAIIRLLHIYYQLSYYYLHICCCLQVLGACLIQIIGWSTNTVIFEMMMLHFVLSDKIISYLFFFNPKSQKGYTSKQPGKMAHLLYL